MLKPPCFSCGKVDFRRVCGLWAVNGVVLLWKVKWISFHRGKVGECCVSLIWSGKWVLPSSLNNLA